MTTSTGPDRLPMFQQELREALHEQAGSARPDYLVDVLAW
jgi:hypothetical protein